jgi:hypothetical protein
MSIDPMALAGARAYQDQQNNAIQDAMRVWPFNALLMEDNRVCAAVLDEVGQPRQTLRPVVTLLWRATGRTVELVIGDDVEGVVAATAPKSMSLQCDRCESAVAPVNTGLVIPFAPRLVALVVCDACRDDLGNGYQPLRLISLPTSRED